MIIAAGAADLRHLLYLTTGKMMRTLVFRAAVPEFHCLDFTVMASLLLYIQPITLGRGECNVHPERGKC